MDRGREIKSLLEALSAHPYDPIKKINNIKKDEDWARDEARGAAQRYIYGNFIDSIMWSSFSVEFGLLVKLDKVLSDAEKKVVPKPFTLGRMIEWACAFSVLDDKTIGPAKEVLKLRNVHIHGSNFISALVISYQSSLASVEATGVNIETIEKGFQFLEGQIPKEVLPSLTQGYKPYEVVEAFKMIKSLSTFEWCVDRRSIKSTKKEADTLINNVKSSFLYGNFERFRIYSQPNYLLKERALRVIKNAEKVLIGIKII